MAGLVEIDRDELLIESHALADAVVVGVLTSDKLENTPGRRHRKAGRPELYAKLVEPQESITDPGWECTADRQVLRNAYSSGKLPVRTRAHAGARDAGAHDEKCVFLTTVR